MISGTLNVCPTIDGIAANPAEVNVGGSIALSVAAHDSDAGPAALGYAWAASGPGALSNANTREPDLHLQRPGHRDRHRDRQRRRSRLPLRGHA